MRRPNFMILGQGKAGTSLIWRVLKRNRHIAFPARKELHFFNKGQGRDIADYDRHFEGLPQDATYIGEVSPSYLDPDAVDQIANVLGSDIKVGFVLRRPVEQAFSRYYQNLCATPQGYDFERYERFMSDRLNQVIDAMVRCVDYFGTANVLPMMYERDIDSLLPTFEEKVLSHLGLPPANHAETLLSGPPVNPGVRPHFIYAGAQPHNVTVGDRRYEVPPNTLVFCAQKRNSYVIENPTTALIDEAMAMQAEWTNQVTPEAYGAMQVRAIFPAANRIERELGYDMSHWRNPPRQITYAPAPPPDRFLIA